MAPGLICQEGSRLHRFVFLDGTTGADLVLSRPTYEIAYHDGRYAYSALPSTAHKVQPGSTRCCGLLLISELYMQGLPQADRDAITTSGSDEQKWPYAAGKVTELRTRLRTKLGGRLPSMLDLLQRVAR